jgi:molecular chaperone GrpE
MSEGKNKGPADEPRDAEFEELDEEAPESEGATEGEQELKPELPTQEIAQLRAELAASNDKYLRALAEFENYKKRALKERSELLKYQGERTLADLLEVFDNLERALNQAKSDPESLQEGVALIHKLFLDKLARWEIKPDSGLGKPFDPNKQKAVSSVVLDDTAPGTVVNEMRKAFFYRDRLLRAGEVVVAAPREETEETEEPEDRQDNQE